jgi:hypothetical protein
VFEGVGGKFVIVFRVHKAALNYIGFKSKCFWEEENEGVVSFSKINILIIFFLIQKNKSLQNMYALECAQIFKHKERNATSLWRVKNEPKISRRLEYIIFSFLFLK